MSMQTSYGKAQVDYTGHVGKQPTLYFPQNTVCNPSILLPAPLARRFSGAPEYDSWETQRKQHALQIGNWKDDEWPLSA
jgi:hypothetical protein